MTIVDQATCSTAVDVPQPITAGVELVEQILEPASMPADEQTRPSSRSRRWTAFARRRQYNHPRRERFVEEATMSREMDRLEEYVGCGSAPVSQRRLARTFLQRSWLSLVTVIAVNGPQAPEEFNPKRLTYELSGSIGNGGGMLVYVDIDGHPQTNEVNSVPTALGNYASVSRWPTKRSRWPIKWSRRAGR